MTSHTLLVANRGEIAVRILRTAKKLGIATVAIYTPSDALAPHVALADTAVALPLDPSAKDSESAAYLSPSAIITICKAHNVTLLHPGYGFLSENASFAAQVRTAGVTFLGPDALVIAVMGRKHEAREVVQQAGVSVVPGSPGLVQDADACLATINNGIGWPVIIKATAGGGGIGMIVCTGESELHEKFAQATKRAKAQFSDGGIYVERYFPAARHIEVQVFGNGKGDVVHMGVRECSIQRRHQKVVEETPSPFLDDRPGLGKEMCDAAVRICQTVKYGSAGTVEFIVDDKTGEFYFLEMNTRIQVEHPITETTRPGLDIVELMIQQGIAEHQGGALEANSPAMDQRKYDNVPQLHAIEVRVYAENPKEGFRPSPGLLQYVDFCDSDGSEGSEKNVRVDTWVATGTTVTPFFDPLLAKLIVTSTTRGQAIAKMEEVLVRCAVRGPPNNIEYLSAIMRSDVFRAGKATTRYLDTFEFTPRALTVISAGLESTIQDLPGRRVGLGIPHSGPMDPLAFSIANTLVGNPAGTEAVESIVVPGVSLDLQFHVETVVAVTGRCIRVKVNGEEVPMWQAAVVATGKRLEVIARPRSEEGQDAGGLRVYVAVKGGFPQIPVYLGSKSTSMGLGGYQGRSLLPGDQIALAVDSGPGHAAARLDAPLAKSLIPTYPKHWNIYVLAGPHGDNEFVTAEGIREFYSTIWRVSPSSNRMGIRLEGPDQFKIGWARANGGEGGSHPSNILDNAYARGSINVNGDTPVILGNEGPDMGGYVCLCTVIEAELWKVGQLGAGSTVKFQRVSWEDSMRLRQNIGRWVDATRPGASVKNNLGEFSPSVDFSLDPKLHVIPASEGSSRPKVVFRQAGESAILVEYGPMSLDFKVRARLHAFEVLLGKRHIRGVGNPAPCIRSTMCPFDPIIILQNDVLSILIDIENSLPDSVDDMVFSGRKVTFPIVLNDRWNREALERYMRTTREKAVYLPSNVQYLADNNGLDGGIPEALEKLVKTDWLVFGVGFYLACPFLVPIDPRCRLVGQKMNPSRTYTPRGAIGIAGLVAAIYPIESPGGYQLYGRTLPAWQTWGKGTDFDSEKPWLLRPFDQVRFEPVTEEEYSRIEEEFDAGRYSFKIEVTDFSIVEYASFVTSVQEEVTSFKQRQAQAVANVEIRERELLAEWETEILRRRKAAAQTEDSQIEPSSGPTVVCSLFASIWKVKSKLGDIIKSASDVVVILEAMKTEINVYAGEENIGRKVRAYGKGVIEGAAVLPGDVLVIFE